MQLKNTKRKAQKNTRPVIWKQPKKHQERNQKKYKVSNLEAVNKYQNKISIPEFPPSAPSQKLTHQIFTDFCKDMHPNQFEESGCAVCGQLQSSTPE